MTNLRILKVEGRPPALQFWDTDYNIWHDVPTVFCCEDDAIACELVEPPGHDDSYNFADIKS